MSDDSGNIVPVDFGLQANEMKRRFARLLNLAERQREDMELNPFPYLEAAGERMAEMQREMQNAYDGLRHCRPVFRISEHDQLRQQVMRAPDVRITHEDYERLKRLEQIVLAWAPRFWS